MKLATQMIGPLILAFVLLSDAANAQLSNEALNQQFRGVWTDYIRGPGDIIINITNVRPDGRVEGTYGNGGNAWTAKFGVEVSKEKNIVTGAIDSQGVLRIQSPVRYLELKYQNGNLRGITQPAPRADWPMNFKKQR